MTITRNLAAATAALGAAASVALASPAQAEDLNGLYNVHHDVSANGFGAYDEQWFLTPCGAGCLRVQHRERPVWDVQAHLAGTTWTTAPVIIHPYCDAGDKYPLTSTYSFDAVTLQGTESVSWPASSCNREGTDTQRFTLTKA